MAYWLRGHTQDLLHVRSQAHHPLRGRSLGADLVHVEGTAWLRFSFARSPAATLVQTV
jgi:hypothetical protein